MKRDSRGQVCRSCCARNGRRLVAREHFGNSPWLDISEKTALLTRISAEIPTPRILNGIRFCALHKHAHTPRVALSVGNARRWLAKFAWGTIPPHYSAIAQSVEQLTVNQWVLGSSPSRGAKIQGSDDRLRRGHLLPRSQMVTAFFFGLDHGAKSLDVASAVTGGEVSVPLRSTFHNRD